MATVHCTHCGDEASQRCLGCMGVRYCSKECQQADWKWHKLLCKEFEAFVDKPETGKELRRAILLPAYSTTPVFRWVEVSVGEGEDLDDYDASDISFNKELGVPEWDDLRKGMILPVKLDNGGCDTNDDPVRGSQRFVSLVAGTKGHGELLDHSVVMMCRDTFFHLQQNPCLARLQGADLATSFRGPLLFIRMTKVDSSHTTLDIDASDFTLALDGLAEYARHRDSLGLLSGRLNKKVPAIKVNAGIPYYEETKVLRTNPIFTAAGKSSALSRILGLPLVTQVSQEGTQDEDASETEQDLTQAVEYLNLCIDPKSPNFGTLPTGTNKKLLSTLVAREDKSTITTSTLIGLFDFLANVAQPVLSEAKQLGPQDRQAAVDRCVKLWQQHSTRNSEESDEELSEEEENGYDDTGAYDDLADVRAKMGSMQMGTTSAGGGLM